MGFGPEQCERAGRDPALAKEILLEIVRASGGAFSGMTRLYKSFYLAHLFYYRSQDGFLSDWPVVRMPNGPGIDRGSDLIRELVNEGKLSARRVSNGPYTETILELVGTQQSPLPPESVNAVAQAVAYVSNMSGTQLSAMTHEYSRSWLAAEDGDQLNIYIDLVSEDDFSSRQEDLEKERNALEKVFGP